MTDVEIDDAGTLPDGYSFISDADLKDGGPDLHMSGQVASWRRAGMTWSRVTRVETPAPGVWMEVWKTRPVKEAPFDPPYTLEAPREAQP